MRQAPRGRRGQETRHRYGRGGRETDRCSRSLRPYPLQSRLKKECAGVSAHQGMVVIDVWTQMAKLANEFLPKPSVLHPWPRTSNLLRDHARTLGLRREIS